MVLQSSTKGIRAVEIASKLKIHKTIVHRDLNSLYHKGKVESDQGIWKAKTEEQTIKPSEKEIVIELPLPKNKLQGMVGLKVFANSSKDLNLTIPTKMLETIIETFNETRTIKIRGKNVDDLELAKIVDLIKEANEKSSKINLKNPLKKLKKFVT